MNDTLDNMYNNPKYGLSGLDNFQRKIKELEHKNVTKHDLVEYLHGHSPYTLHKPIRKAFTKERVYVHKIDEQWQADLVEMIPYSIHNDGHKYILMVIDVFSKYAWGVPLKSKSPEDVKHAFLKIFQSGRKPKKIQTDDGMEFFGKQP